MKFNSIIFFIFFIFIGCSPKKNTFFSRLYQPIPTAYNILYNGNIAFEKGKNTLNSNFKDNFFEVLPIEPISLDETTTLLGKEDFERAEEKATKAIQKHSMSFDGQQHNRKISAAYLLLGKSRYYNQRFLSALQAFNHLLINFQKTSVRNQAFIWREKTHIQLNRESTAIHNLEEFLQKNTLNKQEFSEAQATLAQAFINLKNYEKAVLHLTQAGENSRDNLQKGRYFFISAQLFERLNKQEKALEYYQKVNKLNRRIPRVFWVEAHLAQIKNLHLNNETGKAISFLNRLENDFEYKPFLGSIYFTHAQLINNKGSENQTINLLKQSLKFSKNSTLKQKTHQALGELFFEQKQYAQAHTHYDSTLVYLPKNTLEYLFTRRKRDNLSQVANLEHSINQIDSILSLNDLSEKEKIAFMKNQIENSTEKTQEKSITQTNGTFYFYNINALTKGKQEFIKTFGNRKLTDNWRWENKEITQDVKEVETTIVTSSEILQNTLPTEKDTEILNLQKNKILYQLGIIYDEKFKDKELSFNRFYRILENNPTADLEEKVLYQLSQLSPEKGIFQAKLISKFPNSAYTKIVQGEVKTNNEKLEEQLADLKILFEKQEFQKILTEIQKNEIKYKSSSLASKWEFLKIKTEGRLKGIIFYRKALLNFKENYPNSNEIQEVNSILKHLTAWEKVPDFYKGKSNSWKIIYPFSENYFEFIKQWLDFCQYTSLKVTSDVYNETQKWIVLHGFSSENHTKNIIQQLQHEKEFPKYIFTIESENYEIIQKYKNINEYLKNR